MVIAMTDSTSRQSPSNPRVLLNLPRLDVFEINDQSWWPNFLREKVQDALTLAWINKFPILQRIAPCDLVARVLAAVLQDRISDYVYVDFASGAGGPTPFIERQLNRQLTTEGKEEVQFVLSDISPHIHAWETASKKSENLHYIPKSIDASAAPPREQLFEHVPRTEGRGTMRLFSLAFHHFDDNLAKQILQNTIDTSDGFCIFELQQRNYSSLLTVFCLWPMLLLTTPFYYLHDPVCLFFTYLVPLVPIVIQFDGLMSMLRTRTPQEVQDLLKSQVPAEELAQWTFRHGEELHTWPFGWLSWIICYKHRSGH